MLGSVFVFYSNNGVHELVFSVRCSLGNSTAQLRRHNKAMLDNSRFGAGGVYHAAFEFIAGLDLDLNVPFLIKVKRRHRRAS